MNIMSLGLPSFRSSLLLLLIFYQGYAQGNTAGVFRQSAIINEEVKRDLEMFKSHAQSHPGIIAQLDTTITSFGRSRLRYHLENPITDISLLKIRQTQIQYLLENPELVERFKRLFAVIKKNEAGLHYFTENLEDSVAAKTIESFYFQSKLFKKFNASSLALNARNVAKHVGILSPVVEHLFFHFALEHIQKNLFTSSSRSHVEHDHHHHGHDHAHCIHDLKPATTASTFVKGAFLALKGGHLAMHLISIKEICHNISAQQNVVNELHQKVSATKCCLSAMAEFSQLMKKHECFNTMLGEENACINFFNTSENMFGNDLVKLSHEPVSKKKKLGFLSPIGNTLKHYRILKNQAAALEPMLSTLGDLEALIAIVDWMKKVNSSKAHICFVDFIEFADQPMIDMKGLWNIALDPHKVVTNDVSFGGLNRLKKVLTGANKGGKSSIIKALGLNIWLAHSFGIAAANSVKMTPISKLITNIIVSDDTCHDTSMMVAEIMRAEECLKSVADLKNNEFAFVLIDDSLFKGTTHEKGQKLAYQFIKKLGEYKNCCAIVATHTPLLTQLENDEPDIYKNYKIRLGIDDQGKSYSTFQMEEGVADASLVFDVIRSQRYSLLFN